MNRFSSLLSGTRRSVVLALGALTLASAPALAAWPERPIEIVVGFAPGGGTDITARSLAVCGSWQSKQVTPCWNIRLCRKEPQV